MNYETIENISDKTWWLEVDMENSDIPVNQHIQSVSNKFFGLQEHVRPAKIFMRPNAARLCFGERLIANGLPIHFVKDRETIHLFV